MIYWHVLHQGMRITLHMNSIVSDGYSNFLSMINHLKMHDLQFTVQMLTVQDEKR